MLIFSVCLLAAVVTRFSVEWLLEPFDYNRYIRELQLNIPGVSENSSAMQSCEPELQIH
jgi:hypothetical protein